MDNPAINEGTDPAIIQELDKVWAALRRLLIPRVPKPEDAEILRLAVLWQYDYTQTDEYKTAISGFDSVTIGNFHASKGNWGKTGQTGGTGWFCLAVLDLLLINGYLYKGGVGYF
jgi:hypothetical protein